jgi:hypothetical protein
MVPLPLPDELTVHQAWLLTTVQDEFDVTANEVDPAGVAGTFWLEGVTESVGLLLVPVIETSSTAHQYPWVPV